MFGETHPRALAIGCAFRPEIGWQNGQMKFLIFRSPSPALRSEGQEAKLAVELE